MIKTLSTLVISIVIYIASSTMCGSFAVNSFMYCIFTIVNFITSWIAILSFLDILGKIINWFQSIRR